MHCNLRPLLLGILCLILYAPGNPAPAQPSPEGAWILTHRLDPDSRPGGVAIYEFEADGSWFLPVDVPLLPPILVTGLWWSNPAPGLSSNVPFRFSGTQFDSSNLLAYSVFFLSDDQFFGWFHERGLCDEGKDCSVQGSGVVYAMRAPEGAEIEIDSEPQPGCLTCLGKGTGAVAINGRRIAPQQIWSWFERALQTAPAPR